GALNKRGELDGNIKLSNFTKALEKACIDTVESGVLTKDLLPLFSSESITPKAVNSQEFIEEIAARIII
ncbi:MAG: NADP-dependent isocitrate dehydrogenase, partial [Clostridia bacterium]|nr:NADP-dependent isocitrate dehydrogenase [Clostridia bacterium]